MSVIPHSRPTHDGGELAVLQKVLQDNYTASGPVAVRFADTLRRHFQGGFASLTASGTLALVNALAAIGIEAGDDVVIPTYVCVEVADAVRYLGATPVLCDIDEATYAPSAPTIAAVRTPRTRAIVVPHMFGIAADIEAIRPLGLPIVEDLAQGLGARWGTSHAGTYGDATVLSFKAIKMISAGEGGAVIVRQPGAAARIADFRARRHSGRPSFEFQMPDLTAALAEHQWERLDTFIAARRRLATRYLEALASLRDRGVGLPADLPGRSWFRFPISLPEQCSFGALQDRMLQAGVHVRRPVDDLLHRGMATAGRFPVAERAFDRTLSIPLYPSLTDAEQQRVIDALTRALSSRVTA